MIKQLTKKRKPDPEEFLGFNKAKVSTVFVPAGTPDTSLLVLFRCNAAHRIHLWWLHMKGHMTTWIKHCGFGYGSWWACISFGEEQKGNDATDFWFRN
ncbi:hypothetical protein Bca4012_036506 [Brassica carinata]